MHHVGVHKSIAEYTQRVRCFDVVTCDANVGIHRTSVLKLQFRAAHCAYDRDAFGQNQVEVNDAGTALITIRSHHRGVEINRHRDVLTGLHNNLINR